MSAFKATDANFKDEILNADKVALVDFWATWCPPCRQMGPIVEELAADYEGRAIVAKIDVDENPRTAATYGVSSIPTFAIFKDGELVKSFVGALPKRELAAALDQFLG